MFVIPQKENKKFVQPNYGDTQGNLWGTFNVDLTKNTGRVRATRTETVFSENDDADLDLPVAFSFFDWDGNGQVFAAYAGKVFWGGDTPIETTWTQDTLTNTPSDSGSDGDMVVFNDKLYATTQTKLKRLESGDAAWVDIDTLVSGGNHQLCVYAKRLYYVEERLKIHSIDAATETPATSGDYTLDLSYYGGNISWMVAGSNRIWIGLTSNDGSKGQIFEWDGVSENAPSKNYVLEAQGSAGATIWNDIPYVMDIEGRLLAFTGANFEEVARLPIMQYEGLNRAYATGASTKICHFNGIKYINDAILILINNESTDPYGTLENYPSGIYEYTKENGLTHKLTISKTVFGEDTDDYGQHSVNETGAIFDATVRKSNATSNYASVMFGSIIEDENQANISSIHIDVVEERNTDPVHKRLAYIITPYLESQRITEVWQKIVIKYRKLLDITDKIYIKYRTTKDIPIVIQNITWDSDTAFTDSDAEIADLNVGDEIEVLNGNGGGALAHILSIVDNGADYTVTLDESIIGVTAGDISDVRFQTWKKIDPEITADTFQFSERTIPQYNKDTEIQFKIVMNWDNGLNELREVMVVNETEQYAK